MGLRHHRPAQDHMSLAECDPAGGRPGSWPWASAVLHGIADHVVDSYLDVTEAIQTTSTRSRRKSRARTGSTPSRST